jgi:membrane fusion protein, multidrug efflux system
MEARKYFLFFCLISVFFFFSKCTTADDDHTEQEIHLKPGVEAVTNVDTTEVKERPFDVEILSNGKAYANNIIDIKSGINEKILEVLVRNGDRVAKNQILAKLDGSILTTKLGRYKQLLERAAIELDDRLIDYGYRIRDTLHVPKDILKFVKIKSGYSEALYNFLEAKSELKKIYITSPISGKVANINNQVYNVIDQNAKFCSIVNDERMLVEFNVLESELMYLQKNAKVMITGYGDAKHLIGKVQEINPMIDNGGMIKVTAIVANDGQLLNGMSVHVTVSYPLGKQISVPKQAVLKRQEREVVFTLVKGKAKWNYVEIGPQNSHDVVIKNGLKTGDKVIISNNLTLAHDSPVIPNSKVSE